MDKASSAIVTLLLFQVSIGGGDCLPSGDPSALLPAYTIKNVLFICYLFTLSKFLGLPRWSSGRKSDCLAMGLWFDSRLGQNIARFFSVFRKFQSRAIPVIMSGAADYLATIFFFYPEIKPGFAVAFLTIKISET
uniref:SFRICE_038339 n=1 Tax=Spodoptera frugiperda TaxID=7108 RepID=A0A2H1VRB5_SPOFR